MLYTRIYASCPGVTTEEWMAMLEVLYTRIYASCPEQIQAHKSIREFFSSFVCFSFISLTTYTPIGILYTHTHMGMNRYLQGDLLL